LLLTCPGIHYYNVSIYPTMQIKINNNIILTVTNNKE